MKRSKIFLILLGLFLFCLPILSQAEEKLPAGRTIPKIPQTPDDPTLEEGHVYPFWGAPCTRYTYSVIYKDKEGLEPEYMRIYFNGDWIDLEKADPEASDYKQGVKYIYQYVPKSTDSNFYFFEASNGKGKARDSIIDSPDNGPVLFTSSLENNEIAVLDRETGEFVWRFSTGKEWVSKVAISRNNQYLAAKASNRLYLFKVDQAEPLWVFAPSVGGTIGGDVAGGVDISQDGTRIIAALGNNLFLFGNDSNQPIWQYEMGDSAYGVSISADGSTIAAATAGEENDQSSNLLILLDAKSNKPLWTYHSSGNFHSADLSQDGSYVAAATGCPDRRAYIFSRDSADPLVRTEMLTRDSPVHASAISADGQYAAFGAESDNGAVHLFQKDSDQALWKLPTPRNKSVRSLAITPDGQYIGAATFGGDAYILSRESSNPLRNFKVQERLGAADISDDGTYLAVGGSNKGIYLFSQESPTPIWQNTAEEFVNTIDFSADASYVAIGTGASVYFFESDEFNPPSIQQCSTVLEPEPEAMMGDGQEPRGPAQCGNTICEPDGGENPENCPADCASLGDQKRPTPPRPGGVVEEEAGFPWLLVLFTLGGLAIIVLVIVLWRKGILVNIFKRKPKQETEIPK